MLCDLNVSCGWTDYRSHEALPPIWSLPSRCWTGENPIIRFAIFCVTLPRLQSSARRKSSGIGFCDASVLQGPTTWNTRAVWR